MKKTYCSAITIFSFLTLSLGLVAHQAQATTFHITVTNLSPNVLSPTALVSHDAGFDLFDTGGTASSAVEALAEAGDTTGIISLAAAAGPTVQDYQVTDGGVLAQNFSGNAYIDADTSHPWLSFLSMLGISNDGFIGGATGDGAISLFSAGAPVYGTYTISPDLVWDAGTEVNDEALGSVGALGGGNGGVDENGFITLPHPGILGVGGATGIPVSRNWTGGDVAQITVAPVPEPATMMLLGTGLAGMAGARLRKKGGKKASSQTNETA